jgi:hypothetical protein
LEPFIASTGGGDLTYENFLKGLNCNIKPASTELLRSVLLSLDPYETGKVKLSLLEIEVRKLFRSTHETKQHQSQAADHHSPHGGSRDDLGDFTMALEAYNNRWRRELTELSAQPKRTEAELLYYNDVTELITINSTTLSCLSEVREEASAHSLNQDGFHLARAKKARALLGSKQLRTNLLTLLELQRDLINLYLLARGFRLHGSAFPASEEKKRVKLLSRLRKYRDDMLLLVKVVGENGEAEVTLEADTPEAQAIAATAVWRTRASDRLWAEFAGQLRTTSNKMINNVASFDGGYSLLQRQFQSMDDGSGEVTYWEFFEAMRQLGAKMDESESDLMVQALDATGSGKIKVEVMLKHFSKVLRETSDNPPTTRAMSIVAAQLTDTLEEALNSTAKFMADVLVPRPPQLDASERRKLALMQQFVGDDPELAQASGLSLPSPMQTSSDANKDVANVNKLFFLSFFWLPCYFPVVFSFF